MQTTTNIPELTLEHFNRYSTHEIMAACELNKVGDIEVDINQNEGLRSVSYTHLTLPTKRIV